MKELEGRLAQKQTEFEETLNNFRALVGNNEADLVNHLSPLQTSSLTIKHQNLLKLIELQLTDFALLITCLHHR